MKFMIALSCLLAVASAGYVNSGVVGYAGTPAVAYNAPLVSAPHPVHAYAAPYAHAYAAPVAHAYAAPVAHAYAAPIAAPVALASEARLVDPIAIAAGAPLPTGDTVEVAAAKAAHYHAHAVEKSRHYGAPIAHAVAPIAHAGLVSEARLVDPIAIAAGAPLPTGDTVEVAAAKALHYQAHAAAKGHLIGKRSPGYLNAGLGYSGLGYAAPVHSYGYSAIASPLAYSAYGGHFLGKRSPGYLNAGLGYAAPVHSYGYSSLGYSNFGYGGLYY